MFYVLSSPSPIKTFENKLRRDPAILNLMRIVDPLVKPEDDSDLPFFINFVHHFYFVSSTSDIGIDGISMRGHAFPPIGELQRIRHLAAMHARATSATIIINHPTTFPTNFPGLESTS